MNSIRYILYFVISFVLQLLWFFLVKENSNATILDMLMMSLLFTLFMFILDKFLKKSRLHKACFFVVDLKLKLRFMIKTNEILRFYCGHT
ncbi:hypothetical protein ES966_16290 [Bacillus velezensis]|nr:hypothetical protein ES966_16290 [Bacillus velezensis]